MLPKNKTDLFKRVLEKRNHDIITEDYIKIPVSWNEYRVSILQPWVENNIEWLDSLITINSNDEIKFCIKSICPYPVWYSDESLPANLKHCFLKNNMLSFKDN